MDVNIKLNGKVISKGKLCNDYFSKFRGLMFSKKLKKENSVILVCDFESRFCCAIHMLFVFFPLDVIFLNKKKEVVDIRKSYPFVSFIAPKSNSKYVIEMNMGENILKIGDKVIF
jgi:uncharacterized protein